MRGTYHSGGAWLATQTGAPVLPVAHNAGDHWPRNSFLKYPGVVTISVGAPIYPNQDTKAGELTRRVETWIEEEMLRIRPA
jgi:1-acyl-sn-glycerol-3-phosphate acyltransferase